MEGYVYILINSSFPNLVKIGRTTKTPNIRAQELSSTGTPGRFVVAYSVLVNNCVEIEYEMHVLFANQRHTNDREFFEIESSIAINKLIEISNDRMASNTGSLRTIVDVGIATLYLIKVSSNRNIYRIGLISKPKTYLKESEFKDMVIDLYHHFDANFFYDCEILELNEFMNVDEEAIIQMQGIIDNNLLRLKNINKSILDVGKYDVRTFIVKVVKDSFPKQIYNSTLSLLEPVAKASLQRKLNQIELVKDAENKRELESKLLRIDNIKKLGI